MRSAYFAGGCFWCITPVFAEMNGVDSVVSGYSGGSEVNPTYEEVKHQQTGHRETICITYDPEKISFDTLMDIFLQNVDPFDGGGQFIDRGNSYTLAVYYENDADAQCALNKLSELSIASGREVCVSVEPFKSFYPAEEYHQDYYLKHPVEFEEELRSSGRK